MNKSIARVIIGGYLGYEGVRIGSCLADSLSCILVARVIVCKNSSKRSGQRSKT